MSCCPQHPMVRWWRCSHTLWLCFGTKNHDNWSDEWFQRLFSRKGDDSNVDKEEKPKSPGWENTSMAWLQWPGAFINTVYSEALLSNVLWLRLEQVTKQSVEWQLVAAQQQLLNGYCKKRFFHAEIEDCVISGAFMVAWVTGSAKITNYIHMMHWSQPHGTILGCLRSLQVLQSGFEI